jgi:hypothetical protein
MARHFVPQWQTAHPGGVRSSGGDIGAKNVSDMRRARKPKGVLYFLPGYERVGGAAGAHHGFPPGTLAYNLDLRPNTDVNTPIPWKSICKDRSWEFE